MWILFAAVVVVTLGTATSKYYLQDKERVPWRADFAAATAEAKRDGKLRFLYFTASWCGPCQKLKTETWNDRGVESRLAGFVPVKIDVDEHADLAQRFEVDAMPTFIVVDANDQAIQRSTGFMPASDFLEWLGAK